MKFSYVIRIILIVKLTTRQKKQTQYPCIPQQIIIRYETQGGKTGPARLTCLICPHFSVGHAKELGPHPLMCLPRPAPFFSRAFAGTCIYIIFFAFLGSKSAVPAGFPCPHFFCGADLHFRPTSSTMTAPSLPILLASFYITNLNGTGMPVCHPQRQPTYREQIVPADKILHLLFLALPAFDHSLLVISLILLTPFQKVFLLFSVKSKNFQGLSL